jgi:hypothetical protein
MTSKIVLHRVLYGAGILFLVLGMLWIRQLAFLGVVLILLGARTRRSRLPGGDGVESGPVPADLMNADPASRPGLHDRYEGVVTSLMRWTL